MKSTEENTLSTELYDPTCKPQLSGLRYVVQQKDDAYPRAFSRLNNPPEALYVIGSLEALQEGLAIVGARKATPYGTSCARRFGRIAARNGVVIISGGALGCDSAAHRAALLEGAPTVVFLGGGCDQLYPARNKDLFQDIINAGGAIVSEYPWGFPPKPYTFRARNRLIASLARATLIVEAGLPSGTFSTADEALQADREVLVVPGAITSNHSKGANRLLYQGAVPVVDDESFCDILFGLFGCLHQQSVSTTPPSSERIHGDAEIAAGLDEFSENIFSDGQSFQPIFDALSAEPMNMQELFELSQVLFKRNDLYGWISKNLMYEKKRGTVKSFPDGRYGVVVDDLD